MDIQAITNETVPSKTEPVEPKSSPRIDLASYKKILVAFSGGKDSVACVLWLIEELQTLGYSQDQIADVVELWHHDIDGRPEDEGTGGRFMDWPVTPSYCQKFAQTFGLPLYFSWKVGGFWREMHRENALTAPIRFELPDGTIGQTGGTRGKPSTRRKYPQVSPDLSVRWCSAYLKIDVMSAAIRAQDRFNGIRTLVITGERAQESSARSKYLEFEPHRSHCVGKRVQRHVDQIRPIHKWVEEKVWDIIKRWRVRPHPAYLLGFGRVSCALCIFGNSNQMASAAQIVPDQAIKVWEKEVEFGVTIKRNKSVEDQIGEGQAYDAITPELSAQAAGEDYSDQIILPEGVEWELPAGAFGESDGPV